MCSAAAASNAVLIGPNRNMVSNADLFWLELPGVIQRPELRGIEENAEDLRVIASRPLRGDEPDREQEQTTKQAVQQVEHSCSGQESGEEQPALSSEYGQRPIH